MKRFWQYTLVVVLALVASSAVAAIVSNAVVKGKLSEVAYRSTSATGEEYIALNPNEYGFQNASLALGEGKSIGSAPDLIPAAERAVHSVVHIRVQGEQTVRSGFMDPFDFFFGGGDGMGRNSVRPVVGYGSGVIISNDGYIITNNHVIDAMDKIEVTLNDNRVFEAKKIGSDPATDIALLKIETNNLPTLPFGNSDALRVGEWVLAVGNPFNLTGTVTAGIVSAKARPAGQTSDGENKIGGFIQTDAAVNAGNSGGALVNARGELVGINTMIYSQTGSYSGYSFAVPINTAAKVVADIKKYGTVQRAVLGIAGGDVTNELKEKHNLKVNSGVFVADFSEVSAAYAAGMEKGDVITAIDGSKLSSFAELQSIIAMKNPGDKIRLSIDRKGTTKDLVVTLKNTQGSEGIVKGSVGNKLLGATLKELPASARRSYGISYGVEVTNVGSGKMQSAGIKKGFIILSINNVAIRKVADAHRVVNAVQNAPRGRRSLIVRGFYPNGRILNIQIDL